MRRSLAAAVLASAVAVLPVPLVGGFAVLIQEDLQFGAAQLGVAIAAFFLAAAITAAPAGRLSEFIGPRSVARFGLGCILSALLGIGLVADGWASLAFFLALAGVGHALTLLAVGVLLTRSVPLRRQGLAFGGSQAAAPLAALLAGLAVPTIGLTLGWQLAFVACGALAIAAAIFMPGTPSRVSDGKRGRAADAPTRALVLLAVGMGLASAGGNSTVVFIVASSVDAGFSTGVAGILLAIASAFGICVRIGAGWLGDRTGGDAIGLLAALIAVGAIGYVGLAITSGSWGTAVATILAFAGGWGWPGVMLLVAARSSPAAPGIAMGIVTLGGLGGAVVGPIVFGATAETASYSVSWLLLALLAVGSLGATLLSGRWMRRSQAARAGTPDPIHGVSP